jgi:hypothetical protein
MPADGQDFVDQNATARTPLAGIGGRHGYSLLPRVCCFESKDGEERHPARIANAFGEVVVPEQVGRLQVLMIDRVIGADERQRRLVVEVLTPPLARRDVAPI